MTPAPTLDRFQQEAVDFMDAARGRVIYADPMGARKTATTLTWLARRKVHRTLVVAPLAVHGHWAREAARFYPGVAVGHYRGSPLQRQTMAGALECDGEGTECYAHGEGFLLITSYATMERDVTQLAGHFDAIVFDEGHRLKGRRTQVALAANKLTTRAAHVICATGTPILNHPAELWQYLHMLNPKGYTSFWRWVDEYFIVQLKYFKGRREPTRIIGGFISGQHEQRLRASLIGVMLQRELAEMFDVDEHPWIVEPDHVVVPVELTPAERKAYTKMADDFWVRLPGGRLVNAGNALVANTRLQQFSSDWGTLDATMEKGAKLTAAIELVSDLAQRKPVIVFAKYKATVQRLILALAKAKLRVVAWTGDTPPAAKEEWLARYVKGEVDVLVGTIASLGEGVDGLQYRTNQVVMLDRDWRPGINDQAIGRVRRSGQNERVMVWHLFNEGTLDESIHESNLRKVNFAGSLKGQDIKNVLYGRMAFDDTVTIEIEEV